MRNSGSVTANDILSRENELFSDRQCVWRNSERTERVNAI
jgi:hypothetical protein